MCFSFDWLKNVLILCVVVGAVILILQLVIPYAISKMGVALGTGWGIVVSVFRILLGALIAIIVILICFEAIACLLSFANIGTLLHR